MTTGRGLTPAGRATLKRDGYLVVPALLGERVLTGIHHRLDELVRQTVAAWQAGVQHIPEPGVVRAGLDLADADFAPCHEHPLLADAATTVLGPGWSLATLSLRAPLPGCGHQGLHPDFEQRRTEEPWQTLSAMWTVTPFTAENGPLRVIPGSHLASEPPIDTQAFGSGMGPHPHEVKVTAPAGSVILFNSASLWHSGTFNYSPQPRLALTAGFAPASFQTSS